VAADRERHFGEDDSDQTVRLWEVATWQERLTLRGHPGLVHGVAFRPDGR
jgi:hypothetical protein